MYPLQSSTTVVMKQRVLSCIQPTGNPHLGNYFGAIQNWIELQTDFNCRYGVVDYHAITIPRSTKELRNSTMHMVKCLIACGIQPENLFVQSLIPEHAELGWILSCFASYADLRKQVQFKDKSKQTSSNSKDFISAGLFTYPVLQAADILMYHADYVPVGKDQVQHLELTRTIANRFNHHYKTDFFKPPSTLLTPTPKIQSLAEPSKKMSKSLGAKHYIGLLDDEQTIRKKIKSAVTGDYCLTTKSNSPGVENLFSILRALGKSELVEQEFQPLYCEKRLSYSHLKTTVADEVVHLTTGIRERYNELDNSLISDTIQVSSASIRSEAQKTLKAVREIIGFPKLETTVLVQL